MNIIRHRHWFAFLGAAIMLAALGLIVLVGLRPGIDFTGGALIEVAYDTAPVQSEVETTVETFDLGGVSIRETEGVDDRTGFMIRTRDLTEDERQQFTDSLMALGTGGDIIRFTSIGPAIGEELAEKARWAVAGVVIVIILYVAIAFVRVGYPVRSWVYGGITIVALIHDVLVPAALMAVLGEVSGVEVDVLFVTAILAVLGYSVNDTIVVFDRVRENLHQNRQAHVKEYKDVTGVVQKETTYTLTKPFAEIVNMSVLQVITRSVNTSLTTLLALGALYFLGGTTTHVFALILMAGVIAGTYSSIFLASPLLVLYTQYVLKVPVDELPEADAEALRSQQVMSTSESK